MGNPFLNKEGPQNTVVPLQEDTEIIEGVFFCEKPDCDGYTKQATLDDWNITFFCSEGHMNVIKID